MPPSPAPVPQAPGSTVYVVTFPDRGANYPKGTITLSQDDAYSSLVDEIEREPWPPRSH